MSDESAAPEEVSALPQEDDAPLTATGEKAMAALKQQLREAKAKAKVGEEAARRLAELEEAGKSEAQRLEDRAATAQRDRDSAVRQALVYEVALSKGLAPDLAKRLVGNTREELEADADTVLALVAPPEPAPTTNPHGFAVVPAMQGARPSPPQPADMNQLIRARLGRG